MISKLNIWSWKNHGFVWNWSFLKQRMMCFVKTHKFCRWLLGIPGCFFIFGRPSSHQGYSLVKSVEFGSVCLDFHDFHVPSRPLDHGFTKDWSHRHSADLSERPWLAWKIRLSSHPTQESMKSWVDYFQQCRIFLPFWSDWPVFCQLQAPNLVLANHTSGLAEELMDIVRPAISLCWSSLRVCLGTIKNCELRKRRYMAINIDEHKKHHHTSPFFQWKVPYGTRYHK